MRESKNGILSLSRVFDHQEQLNEFEEKCRTCKRYSRNCSILNKAKEGRIQEEIQDMVCSKYKE